MRLNSLKKKGTKSPKSKSRWHGFKNHPFVIPLTTFMVLFFVTMAAFIGLGGTTIAPSDSHVIILSYDGKQQLLPTKAATVGEFLERVEIELHQGDKVEPELDTAITDDNFKINVYRARPVVVIDGQNKVQALSAATTPRAVAEQLGINVYAEDDIRSSATDDILKDGIGEQIVIDRATPVNLNLYGTQLVVRTRAKKVDDLLKEKEVKLVEGDTVQPSLDTPLTPQMQVFITRKGIQIVTEEKTTPPPVEVIEDSSLSTGVSVVRQQGSPGKKLITYQIELQNGKELSRKVIQEVVLQPPVKRIMARGPLGSFGDALARLRQCEAGGNYANKSNPTYRGAYQFNYSTWNNYAGFYDPADAPPAIQDQKATETYQRRGWQPWPACSNKLGLQDIYR